MVDKAVLSIYNYISPFFIKGQARCKMGTISLIWSVEQPNIVAKIPVFQVSNCNYFQILEHCVP
jgi:hypothetical protein